MKVVIIGGVAGGATAAARIRRLDEKAEIIIFEKGEYVSFANCGLPYHISGIIPKRESLILKKPKEFKLNYNIDVRTLSEVISIDTQNKKVEIKDLSDLSGTGKCYSESYDKLLLSPGASAFTPPFKNDDHVPFYVLKTIPDMDRIIQTINEKQIKHATILGGGFIGVEIAENLLAKGIETHIIELSDQVMAPFDFEMANMLHKEIIDAGVNLHLNSAIDSVRSNSQSNNRQNIQLTLRDETVLETQILISAVGVRPETAFIHHGGMGRSIKLNERGAIIVDDYMQTSDPSIWAVGDAVQIKHIVDNALTSLPLAGPANRQGRIAADNIYHHQSARYRGVQGTSIIKVFGLTAASTGINEKYAQKNNIDYDTLYLHPNNHVTYYPGATQISFKIIYNPKTLTLLGAQAVGKGEDGSGVDKRMDVLATVLHAKMPLTELQDIEYTYAPPYGSAKDAINMIGFMASNIQLKLERFISPKRLLQVAEKIRQIIDVRTKDEYALGHIQGAINIPLHEMREKIKDLSQLNLKREEETIVYCAVGVRSHNAFRILVQNGFTNLHNLSGGYKNYLNFFERYKNESRSIPTSTSHNPHIHSFGACHHQLDLSGMQCPGPIVALNKKLDEMKDGEEVVITVSDRGFLRDAKSYCDKKGHILIDQKVQPQLQSQYSTPVNSYHVRILKGTKNIIEDSNAKIKSVRESKKTIVVFSNELDRAMASFIIANGARAMGSEVTLFFTFWGLSLLKKEVNSTQEKMAKTFMENMFSWMLPKGTRGLSLSKMSMFGLGTLMMKKTMKQKNVLSLRELIDSARSSGVKLIACAMSMDVMGIKEHELIDGVEIAGVANYLAEAEKSDTNLFI